MEAFTLSYIITTHNKLLSLQRVIEKLLANKQPNEEIIITDGASTDGTKEYLEQLLLNRAIDVLISEPDKGEAHGFNKCIMRARGVLIKVITDDDDFDYQAIRKCAGFMLSHPEIDLLATNGGKKNFDLNSPPSKFSYEEDYLKWLQHKTPFSFCGLGLMIRKNSIPLVGLFSTNFVRVDAEFALRTTSSKAMLAWYTGDSFVHIANPLGNTITKHDHIINETEQLDYLYFNKKPSIFTRLKRVASAIFKKGSSIGVHAQQDSTFLSRLFDDCDQWLKTTESNAPGRFLF